MLQPATVTVNGITFVTGTSYFVPSLSVRRNARTLRDRRNAVYADATRTIPEPDLGQRMVKSHMAAEDYTIRVCEHVLNERLTAYIAAHQPMVEAKPAIKVTVTKGPRKARSSKTVKHSSECADVCVCAVAK
jgi:hypothetical protein